MRQLFYLRARKRVLVLTVVLASLSFVCFQRSHLVRHFAEDKVSEFMGQKLTVKIGEITGGMRRDMTLQNVTFISGKGEEGKVFTLERMEISYRIWKVFLEKLGFLRKGDSSLKYVGVYFSEENPFVRGFIKLHRYPDRIELIGHISLVLFGEETKRGVKGTFVKGDDGRYDCDMLWDGRIKIAGALAPSGREIELGFTPVEGKRGTVKLIGSIDENRKLSIYSRLDKVNVLGQEVIGDIWISYRDSEVPLFSIKAENLVVNKRPFWDFSAEGGFIAVDRTIFIKDMKWGEGFQLEGKIDTYDPYEVRIKMSLENVDIKEVAEMLGSRPGLFSGISDGEVDLQGPASIADVKGRLHIGEGVLGPMSFRSVSAALEGKLPVIRIVDSRVLKDGGQILVSGEMDFSRFRDNKVFEGVIFETDNKVAVWEEWQILKEENSHVVEATKDKVTISTSMEDENLHEESDTEESGQKEIGLKYKLDTSNSLKVEMDEDNDFLGVEHKIEF